MNTARNWTLLTLFTILSFFAVKWLAAYQERNSSPVEIQGPEN